MPNHCKNVVEVRGEKSEIKKVFDLFREKDWVDFSKVVPMPKEIPNEDLVWGQKPENSEELIEKYGADNWYDWHIKNWGTKWNSYRLEDDEKMLDEPNNKLAFYTAWSLPDKFYQALSAKFPTLEFYVEYADECFGSSCGDITYKDGREIDGYCRGDDSEEAERFSCKVWGEDYDQWKKGVEND